MNTNDKLDFSAALTLGRALDLKLPDSGAPSVGWAAVAAARVLLKSAGVRIAAEEPSPRKA